MEEKKITNEDLARLIKNGFENTATKADLAALREDMDARFNAVEARFNDVDAQFSRVNSRLDTIEHDIKGIVSREDFDDLMARVKLIETKLGIVSGK